MEDENKKTVSAQLLDMGFEAAIVEKAYHRSEIKTVEGVINFIDAHPNLANEPDTPAGGETGAGAESPGESISSHVNQVFVQQIVQTGYTKDCAEKGLFMTQNASVEAAVAWLEQHKTDPDFLEPLFIVRQPQGPQLTPEEAKKRAKELQAKIREERLKKDKEAELQAEITRLKSGKGLTAAARELEEAQTKLAMMQLQREREETERAKRKIMEEIEKDRRERGLKSQSEIKKPISQLYPDIVKKMQKVYPDPDTVKTCLKTLTIYLSKQPVT